MDIQRLRQLLANSDYYNGSDTKKRPMSRAKKKRRRTLARASQRRNR